jgi:tetratricopeptide (TPR) repeat protein
VKRSRSCRITAQLIDASTDAHLWAESYERDLKDVLALQGEVARTIAGAVNVALTPREQARLSRIRPVNPEAYEAYLKGTYNWMKLTPQGIEASKGCFERALEKDPAYAPAYQGIAWFWLARQQMGLTAPGEAGPKARAAALQAIALDAGSAEAHEALAVVKTWTDWDWAGAEREWQRTFELNPNSANARAYYAHFLAIIGHADEAVPHSERAIELDPSNALFQAMYAVVLVNDRRYDDALAAASAALAIQPDMGVALGARQRAYIMKGMREGVLASQRERIAKDPGRVAAFEKGLSEGGYEGAQRALAELLAARYEKAGGVPSGGALRVFMPCGIAVRFLEARDYDRALDWFEKAYDVRDPELLYGIASPTVDPLRSDPRFQALARRMNLPFGGAR